MNGFYLALFLMLFGLVLVVAGVAVLFGIGASLIVGGTFTFVCGIIVNRGAHG